MKKVVLATANSNKFREIAHQLTNYKLELISQTELGIIAIKETGLTFIENALMKARHAAKISGLPVISDDSGLSVNALKGSPGIYSTRYAGEQATEKKNIEKLLLIMEKIPEKKRNACFHCALVYLRHAEDPIPLISYGTCSGMITREPSGTQGFGYDSIFLLPNKNKTIAEMSQDEKQEVSHRGQALKSLLVMIDNI